METRRNFLTKTTLVSGSAIAGLAAFPKIASAQTAEGSAPKSEPESQPQAQTPPPMQNPVIISMLQMEGHGFNQEANLKQADQYCRSAAQQGADIALFPEMWNIAYNGFFDGSDKSKKEWQARAVANDSPWVMHFQNLAKELGMAIAATYLEKSDGDPKNTLALFDRHGKKVLHYSKMHTCDFSHFEAATEAGEDLYVTELDTKSGPAKIGAMICYDREFPEASRILMLKGAEIVLTPNACQLDDIRLAQFGTRALENSMGMVMTNYAGNFFKGRSVAYFVDGSQVALADEKETILNVTYDLASLRFFRERSIWGNSFRRPHRYGLLTSLEKDPVFERKNAFGEPFIAENR